MTRPRRCPHCGGRLFQEIDLFLGGRPFFYLSCLSCTREYRIDKTRITREPIPNENRLTARESAILAAMRA